MCDATQKQNHKQDLPYPNFDVQGHRGCRGLMPENTLPAFQKALDLQVNTLELDLAVNKDKELIVTHEPYFRSGLSKAPDGTPITKEDELNHKIYEMTYDQIKSYDVGSLPDPKHPERENIRTYKPLFGQVVRKAQNFAFTNQVDMPDLNIEIKRHPKGDHIFHPGAEEFVNIVLKEIEEYQILSNTVIQSFDPESLRIVKAKEPNVRIALLVENEEGIKENLTKLGFTPDIYSCYYKLLDQSSIDYCHSKNIKVIPWTVNEVNDMKSMLALGVDGIITDYPDRLISLVR